MLPIDSLLLIGSLLILASIFIAKVSDRLGVPALVLFLAVGMIAGSEGPGGIAFDDASLAQAIGIVALVFILFAGGLDTEWRSVRPVFWRGFSLATIGVVLTAAAVGGFAVAVLHLPPLLGLLLGAVISSTDAAAVFAVLRSKNVSLKGSTAQLLELESGSNDPMAVFLTVGLIRIITSPGDSFLSLGGYFLVQMGLGALIGVVAGKGIVLLFNRIHLSYDGLYPVVAVASAMFTYAVTAMAGGSGFLAVYIAGIVAGSDDFIHKGSLKRFFDGLAWLSQIGMFLTLGLLVFPTQVLAVVGIGLLTSLFLMFVARPAGVFVALATARMSIREKLFVSWVGLRGAVPVILATFPLLAGIQHSSTMFSLVFFIVLTSALVQGSSIPLVARLLRMDKPLVRKRPPLVELTGTGNPDAELLDFIVPFDAAINGKPIVEIGLPGQSLIVLITRGDDYIVPSGSTVLTEGDALLILVKKADLPAVQQIFAARRDDDRAGEQERKR